jgi:hypothetical protein
MNDSTFELTEDGRRRLDAYLDEVEQRLTSQGMGRSERRSVVDDIEAQATDMLRARSSRPDLDDVQTVLGTLDRPDAYATPDVASGGASAPSSSVASASASNRALLGLVKAVVAITLGLGLLVVTVLFLLAAPAG